MKKAVAYGRFSTDMQREESIDAQFRAIREYCERNNITLLKTYADEGISGTTDNRPAFQEMITDSKLGLFDYVVVHKLDRFARNRYDSAIYKKELEGSNIRVISVLENLDDSPESLILESVLEGMSEYYSKNLSREVKKGMKENALKCQFNGGTPPLGFDIDENKLYIINEYEAEAIKIIFEMYTKGYSYGDINIKLNQLGYKTKKGNEFGKNSLYEILGNEKYCGTYVYSKEDYNGFSGKRNNHKHKDRSDMIIIEDGIPAIISKEMFQLAQEKREKNRQGALGNRAKRVYLLSGLVFCGECGSPMNGHSRKNYKYGYLYNYYICTGYRNHICKVKSIRADKLEEQVLACFDDILFTKPNKEIIIDAAIDKIQSKDEAIDGNKINSEITEIDTQINNVVSAILNGIQSESLKAKLEELEDKKKQLLNIKNNSSYKPNINREELLELLNEESIYSYNKVEQKAILQRFIKRIEISDRMVKINLMYYNTDDFKTGLGIHEHFPHHVKTT